MTAHLCHSTFSPRITPSNTAAAALVLTIAQTQRRFCSCSGPCSRPPLPPSRLYTLQSRPTSCICITAARLCSTSHAPPQGLVDPHRVHLNCRSAHTTSIVIFAVVLVQSRTRGSSGPRFCDTRFGPCSSCCCSLCCFSSHPGFHAFCCCLCCSSC